MSRYLRIISLLFFALATAPVEAVVYYGAMTPRVQDKLST